jgi:WhiB family redox-sensing transcriptional regulator
VIASELHPWMEQAACRGLNADLFYPERGVPTDEAKAVCASCLVRGDCLSYAIENSERYGVWGGLSIRERRRLLRRRGLERPIPHGTVAGYLAHGRRGEQACPECLHAHATRGRADRQVAS